MATARKLGRPMEPGRSGLRVVRRWRVLLAHDATAPTCDALAETIEDALGNAEVSDASSVDDARVVVAGGRFDVCLVCLDLHPAPLGGLRLAREVLTEGIPTVLVTRSLRWVPVEMTVLRDVPWVPPDADALAVAGAIADAMATFGGRSSSLPPEAPEVQSGVRARRDAAM
jgi:hypothetical protein